MKKVILFLTLFFCFAKFSFAQTKLDSLKALGRDSLIKLAVKKINNPRFNSSNYDRVIVKANQTNLIVEFDLSVHLVYTNACYFDKVIVDLYGSEKGENITGTCEMPDFYNPTPVQKEKISFVFNAINKSDTVGYFPQNKLPPGTTMIITENGKTFSVEISDDGTNTKFSVGKISGKIVNVEKSYFLMETEDRGFIEIR